MIEIMKRGLEIMEIPIISIHFGKSIMQKVSEDNISFCMGVEGDETSMAMNCTMVLIVPKV